MGAKTPKIGDAGKAKAKKMNCKPGKSYQCGGACIKLSWNCKKTAGTKAKAKLGELQAANVAAGGGAGSASDVPAKQCNPKKSYLCGKSCIGLSKACKKEPGAKAAAQATEMAKANTVAFSKVKSLEPDMPEDRFGNTLSKEQLKETANGRSPKELATRLAEIDSPTQALRDYATKTSFLDAELMAAEMFHDDAKTPSGKALRFIEQVPSVTRPEAEAMATYIGLGYKYQNQAFYSKDSSFGGGAAISAVLAARGFDKLPKPTDAQIKNVDKRWEPNGTFSRGLTINSIAERDAFVSSFKKGSSYTSNAFMSTTTDSQINGFEMKANVRIIVEPKRKTDGSLDTNGKLVDFAKNKMNEREVLFSPLTKFDVADVVQKENGSYEVYLSET